MAAGKKSDGARSIAPMVVSKGKGIIPTFLSARLCIYSRNPREGSWKNTTRNDAN